MNQQTHLAIRFALLLACVASGCQCFPRTGSNRAVDPVPSRAGDASSPASAEATAEADPGIGVRAMDARDAKRFGECARLFIQRAKARKGDSSDDWYNAASCLALDGKVDDAFAALDQSVAAGLRDTKSIEGDADLSTLHGDPRWPRLLAQIAAAEERYGRSVGNPALRREILAMVDEDQRARTVALTPPVGTEVFARMEAVDRRNTQRMKEIVATGGWPGRKLVGQDGAAAAWLLVQHADRDLAFQKLCLEKLGAAVTAGDADIKHLAYLTDRVAVAEQRKQVYGTQFTGDGPAPIEDEERVDERRRAIGLSSMAAYRLQLQRAYGGTGGPK